MFLSVNTPRAQHDANAKKFYFAFVAAAYFFVMSFVMTPTSATTSEISLACTMRASAKVHVGDAVRVTFELHNRGTKAVHVLMRNTPLEGFMGQYLTIVGPQGELNYGGAMVKRGLPTADEYLRIGAQSKRRRTLNLAEVYMFNAAGKYRIQFTGGLQDVTSHKTPTAPEKMMPHPLRCADIVVEVVAK